jgi:hypothetical protein
MTTTYQTPVLHGSFTTIEGGTFGGTVDYPVGAGAVLWSLEADTYADFLELAAGIDDALETALSEAPGTWATTLIDNGIGGFSIARADANNFSLASTSAVLQTFTGLNAAYTNTATAKSSSDPPFALQPSHPVEVPRPRYVYRRFYDVADDGDVEAVQTGNTIQHHRATLVCVDQQAEVESFRAYARRGTQFRLFHDYPVDQTAWSLSNRDGYLDLVLSNPRTTEEWASAVTSLQRVPIDGRVV